MRFDILVALDDFLRDPTYLDEKLTAAQKKKRRTDKLCYLANYIASQLEAGKTIEPNDLNQYLIGCFRRIAAGENPTSAFFIPAKGKNHESEWGIAKSVHERVRVGKMVKVAILEAAEDLAKELGVKNSLKLTHRIKKIYLKYKKTFIELDELNRNSL
jgi:hypothetical protein